MPHYVFMLSSHARLRAYAVLYCHTTCLCCVLLLTYVPMPCCHARIRVCGALLMLAYVYMLLSNAGLCLHALA